MAHIQEFIKTLPKHVFGFTYGSSYLIAQTQNQAKPQIDIVLCVEDPVSWHHENLALNPHHYAYHLSYLGSNFIVNSANKAAGIHYNPYVMYNDLEFKYGVISIEDLVKDLKQWHSFYLAGRMQKPVHILTENQEIASLMANNYKMALITGVMIGPSLFQETDLYEDITRLSYYGDKRFEDPNKVQKIVENNLERFKEIYRPILMNMSGLGLDNGFIERKGSFYANLGCLPEWISCYKDIIHLTWQERKSFIVDHFTSKNSYYSQQQMVHALKTTSPAKIFKYSLSKLLKSLK